MKAYCIHGTKAQPILKSYEAAKEYQQMYGGYIHEFEMEEEEQ